MDRNRFHRFRDTIDPMDVAEAGILEADDDLDALEELRLYLVSLRRRAEDACREQLVAEDDRAERERIADLHTFYVEQLVDAHERYLEHLLAVQSRRTQA